MLVVFLTLEVGVVGPFETGFAQGNEVIVEVQGIRSRKRLTIAKL
jgi:hypothetical protein